MRSIGGLLFVGALALTGCSSTSLASGENGPVVEAAGSNEADTTTDDTTTDTPQQPDAPTTLVETTQVETTTVATTSPESTVPETTEPETTAPRSTTSTTTTTLPSAVVEVPVLNPPIEPVGNSSGEATKRAQWRLLQLGFWVAEPNGEYDLTTSQAVTAFQKYYGIERDGVLGPETAEVMSLVSIKPHGRSDSGTLMEVDKAKQVLFMVEDGVTKWVLNISSGSGVPYDYPSKNDPNKRETGDAVTRNGLHKIYREQADGWWDGDLGKIYRPKYFTGGIAFHGYNNVPPYPASHGCVRLSLPAMDWIWDHDMMPKGTPVWVHEGSPEEYDSVNDVRERLFTAHTADTAVDPADA